MTRNPDRRPTHPGAFLRDISLPAVDLPKTRIAEMLGTSRQNLYDLLNERIALSPDMAVRIAKMFGSSADTWMRMQVAYDLWNARARIDVASIPTLQAAE